MCRAQEAAEKPDRDVILSSQQATKNLHLLEITKYRSFAPKNGAQDDVVAGVFPQPRKPGATCEIRTAPKIGWTRRPCGVMIGAAICLGTRAETMRSVFP